MARQRACLVIAALAPLRIVMINVPSSPLQSVQANRAALRRLSSPRRARRNFGGPGALPRPRQRKRPCQRVKFVACQLADSPSDHYAVDLCASHGPGGPPSSSSGGRPAKHHQARVPRPLPTPISPFPPERTREGAISRAAEPPASPRGPWRKLRNERGRARASKPRQRPCLRCHSGCVCRHAYLAFGSP